MNAKRYLQQLERLNIMIDAIQRKIDRWKDVATNTTPQTGGERVQSSGNQQKMADAVNKYVDIERDELEPLKRKKSEIISTMERLDNTLQFKVLYMHYEERKDYTQIARELNYSYGHIERAHREGLRKIEKML